MSESAKSVSKILSANDLGATGTHQAGIAIPKRPELLEFFPHLDPDMFNPSCEVTVLDLSRGEWFMFRYIYYNGKLHGLSTRNEYRLTGMTRLLRLLDAQVGDTLIFKRHLSGDMSVTLEEQQSQASIGRPDQVTEMRGGWRIEWK